MTLPRPDSWLFFLALLSPTLGGCRAQVPHPVEAPKIFYTDLISGPNSGGQSDMGAFVTLSGTGFGAEQGTSRVTLGGVPVASYVAWSQTRIIIQLGEAVGSGPLVVHREGIGISNEQPFLVTAGHIYFVGPTGNDRAKGTFAAPWRSLIRAKNALQPGDIVYALDGLVQDHLDLYESALSIQTSGQINRPIAIIAYPGAHVVIGGLEGPRIAVRTPNIDRTSDHWVLAGLTFIGSMEALDVTASTDWRIVGNDFTCPQGFGPSGCVETSQATYLSFLGNTIHDVAQPGTTKAYHALYFSTDSNHIDVGWNTISNVRACRAIQFHSSPIGPGTGRNQFDLLVHDNYIHDIVCDGINFATVDPSRGPVRAYNNIIDNAGTGPDPQDGSADYACIYVQGGANTGAVGTGTVELSGNTLSHCGKRGNTDSGVVAVSPGSPGQHVLLRGNRILLDRGTPLLSPNSAPKILLRDGNKIQ